MSDSDTSGFAKFVPGFEFLQNLAKGAGNNTAAMPGLGHWIAPTMNVEELDKRIGELKNVQFWLEQNSRALSATIQALEVQKMTLSALKGMNFNLGDMATAFGLNPHAPTGPGAVPPASEAPPPESPPTKSADDQAATGEGTAPPKMVDPLQLWGSLAQQFQHIAAGALQQAASAATPEKTNAARPTPRKRAPTAKQKPTAKHPAAKKSARP